MTRWIVVRDGYGTVRTGPRRAWWLPVRDGSTRFRRRRRDAYLPVNAKRQAATTTRRRSDIEVAA